MKQVGREYGLIIGEIEAVISGCCDLRLIHFDVVIRSVFVEQHLVTGLMIPVWYDLRGCRFAQRRIDAVYAHRSQGPAALIGLGIAPMPRSSGRASNVKVVIKGNRPGIEHKLLTRV